MAIRRIVELSRDDILRKHARKVAKFDRRLGALLDDMAATMYKAEGVGLAAPQVGILRRAVVIDVGDGLVELVNPEILHEEGCQGGAEGCLSVPGRRGYVERPQKVRVRAQNRRGEFFEFDAEELFARAVCHELDHLDGIIYLDKMDHEIFEDEEEQDGKEEKR